MTDKDEIFYTMELCVPKECAKSGGGQQEVQLQDTPGVLSELHQIYSRPTEVEPKICLTNSQSHDNKLALLPVYLLDQCTW